MCIFFIIIIADHKCVFGEDMERIIIRVLQLTGSSNQSVSLRTEQTGSRAEADETGIIEMVYHYYYSYCSNPSGDSFIGC